MSFLVLLSPAKKQVMSCPEQPITATLPRLLTQTTELVEKLREFSSCELAQSLKISEKLGELNYLRYQQFNVKCYDRTNACPSLYLFQGDVYSKLDAASFNADDLIYAQQQLRILSGLYGVLRPLDLVHPYRLEMSWKGLYKFWQDNLTDLIEQDSAMHTHIINLASNEYTKALALKNLSKPVITVGFKQIREGQLKNIGLLAKRARGQMTRFILKNKINSLDKLKQFTGDGYQFVEAHSSADNLVFITEDL